MPFFSCSLFLQRGKKENLFSCLEKRFVFVKRSLSGICSVEYSVCISPCLLHLPKHSLNAQSVLTLLLKIFAEWKMLLAGGGSWARGFNLFLGSLGNTKSVKNREQWSCQLLGRNELFLKSLSESTGRAGKVELCDLYPWSFLYLCRKPCLESNSALPDGTEQFLKEEGKNPREISADIPWRGMAVLYTREEKCNQKTWGKTFICVKNLV